MPGEESQMSSQDYGKSAEMEEIEGQLRECRNRRLMLEARQNRLDSYSPKTGAGMDEHQRAVEQIMTELPKVLTEVERLLVELDVATVQHLASDELGTPTTTDPMPVTKAS
jgi:uncharacterized iron-regulated protein